MCKPFPFFFSLEGCRMLMIGAGRIAGGRLETLVRFGARVHVIAGAFSPVVRDMLDAGTITASRNILTPKDLEDTALFRDVRMVFAATDDRALNEAVTRACRERGIPVNNATDRSLCDFYFPAIVEGEDLVLGLAGDGTDHKKVRRVAASLRDYFSGTGEDKTEKLARENP